MADFTAYYAALETDNAYSAAIKKQFGEKANRFSHHNSEYNTETLAAYHAKVAADDAYRACWEAFRAEKAKARN